MSNSDSSNNAINESSRPKKVKSRHRAQQFKISWMELPDFKSWLRPIPGKTFKGKCIACDAEFVSELSTIRKHQNSFKHKTNISVKGKSSTNVLMKFVQSAGTSLSHEDNVKTAEIKLCGFLAEHNISFLSMDHLCPLLTKLFPDSKIAKDLSVRRTKSTAIITNVISPSHKSDLSNIMKTTKFSILTDESTDIAASKSACIVVKHFNEHIGKIVTSLWELTSVFNEKRDTASQGTAEHLFAQIMDTFYKYEIPPDNIIGFGSDGCNIMMGEYNSVSSRFRELCPGIFILKCICHSLHLCSSQACKSLPRATEDLARNIYAFFKSSSKRQSEFREFQIFAEVDIHKILHPSQTRWLSVAAVVKRILEQWSVLQLFFTSKCLDERLLAVEQIHQALYDPFTKLYFMFLNHVLPKITTLNLYFQSEKVVILKMDTVMRNSYKEFLLCYMQRRYVTTTQLSAIDPGNKTWFLPTNQMYLGVDIYNEIKEPEISNRPDLLEHFYERCQQFYSVLCSEIKKRYDFDNYILSNIYIFSPENAISHQIREHYPSLADILIKMPRCVEPDHEQLIDDEWRLLPNYHFPPGNINLSDEIDVFWGTLYKYRDETDIAIFSNLSRFVLNVLSLPHSNAACERVFSKVNLIKTKTRNSLVVNTLNGCLLTSQCIKEAGNCVEFVPNKNMISRMTKQNMYPKTQKPSSDIDGFIIESTD